MSCVVSLRDEVLAGYSDMLSTNGLQVVEDRFDPDYFGDSFLVIANERIRVRLVRDKGQVFGDIGSCSEPDVWWQLADILPCMERGTTPPPRIELNLSCVMQVFAENYADLETAFSAQQYPATRGLLEHALAERAKRFGL